MNDEKTCFVISPIGSEGSEIRERADKVFRHVITPSVEACGFTPLRADHISEPGLITTQVIQRIVEDPLVVADLTGANPNVFYELAVRHVIRKPLVQIVQRGERVPFDVAPMRVVEVDHTDLDSVAEAKGHIETQIRSMVDGGLGDIESPISIAVDLRALSRSADPEQRSLAEVLSLLSELRRAVSTMDERLSALTPSMFLQSSWSEKMLDRKTELFELRRDELRLAVQVKDLQLQIEAAAADSGNVPENLQEELARTVGAMHRLEKRREALGDEMRLSR